jgi:carboxyvinyl-carboxyphosphonate phosphorylmutase
MNLRERRQRFRRVLNGDRCFYPGSVYDPISGRVAEDLGYELGMFAGSTAALVVLGAPDIVLLTLTEFAEQAYRICRACTLPILVDADHGYGNALNVARTVEELESAGVAGLTIEDTALPAAYGTARNTTLISLDEGVGKMRAAIKARRDPDLVIVGRTSAPSVTWIADAIARGKAYEAVGVDGLFFSGIKTRAQLDEISAAMTLPIILGNPGSEVVDLEYLASRHVRICLQGHPGNGCGASDVRHAQSTARWCSTIGTQRAAIRRIDEAGYAQRHIRKCDRRLSWEKRRFQPLIEQSPL